MRTFRAWLRHRWQAPDPSLVRAYQATFATLDGQRVLQHLLDSIYCIVYEGTDPEAAMILNARRSVIQEILVNVDYGEHPEKYQTVVQTQEVFHAPR